MQQPSIPESAQRIVASLALAAKVPVADVAQLYEEKHAELESSARIKSFLPIFALRGVQDVLRGHSAARARESATRAG